MHFQITFNEEFCASAYTLQAPNQIAKAADGEVAGLAIAIPHCQTKVVVHLVALLCLFDLGIVGSAANQ